MSGLFDMEKSAVKRALMAERQLMAASAGVALGGFILLGVLTNKVDRLQKLIFLLPVNIASWSLTAACASQKKKEGFYKAMDTAQEIQLKTHLQGMEAFYSATGKMQRQNNVVKWILQNTPQWQWARRENEFGLQGLFPRIEQPAIAPDSLENGMAIPHVQTEQVRFAPPAVPNLAQVVAADLRNTLTVGVPGSGKGLFISNALGYVQARGDTTVFYLDPKNDEKETGYFEGRVNKLYRLDDGIVDSTPESTRKWLGDCLSDYEKFKVTADKPRKLIVVDELTAVMEALEELGSKDLKWFKRKINTYVASGDSRGITFWGIAQNGHNTGVGMDGGEKSQLTPIALVSVKQLSASQGLQKADFIPSDKKLSSDEIKEICSLSEIGRAIFHGGLNQWFPMPTLPNPSGYDRDNRTFIQERSPSTESTPIDSLEKPQEHDIQLSDQWYQDLQFWAVSLVREPTPQELAQKFYELTQYELTSEGLGELLGEVQQWRRGVKE